MKMQLYHGSSLIVEKPRFGFGKRMNDFGLGFYCTEHPDMAKEWAVRENRDGYVNRYSIETEGLSILNLNTADYNVLHWLSILLENRVFEIGSPLALEGKEYLLENFKLNYEDYDLIRGYRADDSYFSFAQDFISGAISLRQLSNAMMLGDLGEQIVLKSKKAFDHIAFEGYEIVQSREWYEKRAKRDEDARRQYLDVERNRRQKGDIFISQIIDEEFKGNDPRIR
jgi:hypothetical protein